MMETTVATLSATDELGDRFKAPYVSLLPRIEAVKEPRTVNAPWTHLYGVVTRAHAQLELYRPALMDMEKAGFRAEYVDDLPRMMDALVYACSQVPSRKCTAERRRVLREAGLKARRSFIVSLQALRLAGARFAPYEREVSRYTGFADLASDLMFLSMLHEDASATCGHATHITAQDHEEARQLALTLVTLSGERVDDKEAVQLLILRRAQAFTLLYDHYTYTLRVAMQWVLRDDRRLFERIMPMLLRGLHPETGKKRKQLLVGSESNDSSLGETDTSADTVEQKPHETKQSHERPE